MSYPYTPYSASPPRQPGSYNDAPIAFDELNGGGVNDHVRVEVFDAQSVGRPIASAPGYWSDTDAKVRFERREVNVPREKTVFRVRDR